MWLVGGQIALALTLLAGAGLLVQALHRLSRVDPGFQPQGVYAAHVLLDNGRYGSPDARRRYFRRLIQDVRLIPGVSRAALATTTPVQGLGIQIDIPYRGLDGPLADEPEAPKAAFRVITPQYFETIGIPLMQGRDFTDRDREDSPLVVIVNQTLARRAFSEEQAVGRKLFVFAYGDTLELEVIGVVGDTRFAGLDVAPRPALYLTHPQLPFLGIAVVARTTLSQSAYAEALGATALAVDPSQPVMRVVSLETELVETLAAERFSATLLGLFALVAIALAVAGIYGVFAYWVGQRRREIALRTALGASPAELLRLVLGLGLRVTLSGIGAGLAGSFLLATALSRAFRGVDSLDPWVAVSAGLLLTMVAMAACFVPARQAARVEPTRALRGD